ncbi:MAG TPA: amidohydrolase family protein [Verrucomicrobiae bacterium]
MKNYTFKLFTSLLLLSTFIIFSSGVNSSGAAQTTSNKFVSSGLREINPPPIDDQNRVIAIVGATLISPSSNIINDSTVVIRGPEIAAAGPRQSIPIPDGAEIVKTTGLFLIPGLIDSHFHIERDYDLPRLYLTHGVTSLRDPGQWIQIYDPIRKSPLPQPRCFVAGPHLDSPPHAHPLDAFTVTNAEQTRLAVNRFIDEGASVIKVYYRLPLNLMEVACKSAHARGVPVTAHLELVSAADAIRAGLDGIEHITSFGTALADPVDAERFREAVAADNEARRKARYELWSRLDLEQSSRVKPLLQEIMKNKIFVSATLAVFERRRGDRGTSETEVRGFENMLKFAGMCQRAGATLVVGSHSSVPKAERGWAYQRELELLAECGLSPAEVLAAATLNNARYFRTGNRLGSTEHGKLADLVLLRANPLENVANYRKVDRVMLNGRWFTP